MKYLNFIAFVMLVAIGGSQANDNCQLPDFLKNDEQQLETDFWHFHRLLNGEEMKVTFSDTHMEITSAFWETIDESLATSSCTSMDAEQDVFTMHNDESPDTDLENTTLCMRFVQRSPDVVQMFTGQPESNHSVCTADDLTNSIDWVLVRNSRKNKDKYFDCPLRGGFLFDTRVVNLFNSAGLENYTLCEDQPLAQQLDASCLPGEGLLLSFADPYCVPPSTGWTMEQHIMCLDSWEAKGDDGHNYTFAILQNQYGDADMCMRLVKDQSGSVTDLKIFMGLGCPLGATFFSNSLPYMNLKIMERSDPDDCEDDLDTCDVKFCGHYLYPFMCRKTCGGLYTCPEERSCEFASNLQGAWTLFKGSENTSVTVSADSLDIENYVDFSCVEDKTQNTYVVKANNLPKGCLPTYKCAKFSPMGPAVLQYKLSQPWTTYQKESYCTESMFTNDSPPLNDKYHSRTMQNLIASENEKLTQTIQCGFRGNYTIDATSTGSNHLSCHGYLTDIDAICNSTEKVVVGLSCDTSPDDTKLRYSSEFHCLAKVNFGTQKPKALLTVELNEDGSYGQANCWVSKGDGWNPLEFYLMPDAQCNEETVRDIQLSHVSPLFQAAGIRNDSCDGQPITDHTDPSTVTSTVTTPKPTTKTTPPSTTTNPSSEPQTTESSSGGDHNPHTAGIVVGSLFAIAAVGVAIFFGWRWYRASRVPYRVL